MRGPELSGDSDILIRRSGHSRLYFLAAAVAVLGIVLSLLAAQKVRQLEEDRLSERFSRIVQTDMGYFSAVIQRHEGALLALKVRLSAGVLVNRGDFQLAATELLQANSSFAALEWVPRVPGSDRARVEAEARANAQTGFRFFDRDASGKVTVSPERPEHWPILFVEPVAGNEVVLGYDLRSGVTEASLEKARDTGKTVVSQPLQLMQELQKRKSVIGIVAVYRPHLPVSTVEERRAAFMGFVQGISRLSDTFEEVFNERKNMPYDFALFEVVGGNPGTACYYHAADGTEGPLPAEPFAGNQTRERLLDIGQRKWLFSFRATPEWIEHNRATTPALTLAIGLLATLIASGALAIAGRQTRTVEAKVHRRTLALREANQKLEREARERTQVEQALRQSERSLAEAQRIARLGRWESNPATGQLMWSPETFHIFGESPESFAPSVEGFYQRVHPDDRAVIRQQVQAALQLGIPYRQVHRIVLPDQSIRHVEENAELVKDPATGDVRLVGTILDITERRRIEEALAQERNLLRTLLDAIPDAIVVKDREGRFVLLNRANARALQIHDPEIAVGKADSDFQPASEAARQAADDQAVIAQDRAVINREEFITNGSPGWYLTTKIPLHDERGQTIGLVSISRDITDRRRILEELEREHAFLRTLIDTLPDFVYVKDPEGKYILTNQANLRLLGLKTVEEAVGKTVFDLFPADIAKLYTEDDGRVLAGEHIINRQHPARFPDGRSGFILTTKVPIRDREGRITAVFGISRDITEHARLQLEREEMDRRISQSQKLESLGALAGGVAHDFNNILTAILNNATLAKAHPHEATLLQESLGQIEHAAARAAHLCNQMLAYSGRGQFVIQPVGLRELVEDTLPLLHASLNRRADLQIIAEPCDAVAQADVTQIRQIILNLVINASDAIGDKPGLIRLTTGLMHADAEYLRTTSLTPDVKDGDFVFLEVTDTGCGMTPETISRIFEPFFTTKFTGRGLGLAAVLGIIRGHKGAIKVSSTPGVGTTFRLLLPAVFGVASASLRRKKEIPVEGKATGRVLVIDDEDFIRSVLCRSLERVGFQPVAAASGQEAVQLFGANPQGFAAALLDLTMPKMDGQQTFVELRRINPQLPVLLMSGFSESEATARFAGQGLAGFIQKPFEITTLIDQLKSVIQTGTK